MWGWGVADGASSFEVCASGCRAGVAGTGTGQFSEPTSVAVDGSTGSSQGDIYVGDRGNHVVDKFSPTGSLLATITGPSAGVPFVGVSSVAVDPSGNVWVAETGATVYELDDSGTLVSTFNDSYGETVAIAVDASESVYLIRGSEQTEKWTEAGRASGTPEMFDNTAGTGLAVDPSTGDVYVDLGSSVHELEASGKVIGTFGTELLASGSQMAYDPNATISGAGGPGALYAADRGGNDVAMFVPPTQAAPKVLPTAERATSVSAKSATLEAKVNPDGVDTHVYFEYGLTAAYGSQAPAPPGTDLGSNFEFTNTATAISGLTAGTTYHFRAVATNALGTTYGPDETFTTPIPTAPIVSGESATGITAVKATLQATVSPQFADTHYIVEYGTTAAYGTQTPLPPGNDVGETGEQNISVAVTGLQPQTTYHFRIVATNSVGTTEGSD